MIAIHDNDGESKVDLHEQYEKSILAPLRRRLSDVGSTATATPIHASPARKMSLTPTSPTADDQISAKCKEKGKNAIPAVSHLYMTVCEQNMTPDAPSQHRQNKKLKSCLSASSNKKRRRSPLTTPSSYIHHSNYNIHDQNSSPTIEPSRKKQRYIDLMDELSVELQNDKLSISRRVVHFAPSSAVEYELEVPVCQSLTPIPADTAGRRYPTEMKAISTEEIELIKITKQNYAILKAFDDIYDSDNSDNERVPRQRKRKSNRRKSFYIPSTSSQSTYLKVERIDDPLLRTI